MTHPRDAIPLVQVNDHPLQRPNRDRLLRTVVLGGPETRLDHRLYLSTRELEMLLDVARASPTGRAILPSAGVRVDQYLHEPDGGGPTYQYEVWRLVSGRPYPELGGLIGGEERRRG